jgi:internalin A
MKILVLAHLQVLNLLGTEVNDEGVKGLIRLNSLQYLMLTQTSVSDTALSYVAKLPALRSLALRGTAVSDTGIAYLCATGIRALWLGNTKITGRSFVHLGRLSNLEVLDLTGLSVASGLEAIGELAKLRWVSLRRTDTSDGDLSSIGRLEFLTWLDLAHTRDSGGNWTGPAKQRASGT